MMEEQIRQGLPTMLRSSTVTFIATFLLSFVVSILIARLLGAELRGELSLVVTSATLLSSFSIIASGGNDIQYAHSDEKLHQMFGNLVISCFMVLFLLLVVVLFTPVELVFDVLGVMSGVRLLLCSLLMASIVLSEGVGRLVTSRQNITGFNAVSWKSAVLQLVIVATLFILAASSVDLIMSVFILRNIYKLYSFYIITLKDVAVTAGPYFTIDGMLESIALGIKAFFMILILLLVMRVNVLMLGWLSSSYEVGCYAVAMTVATPLLSYGRILSRVMRSASLTGREQVEHVIMIAKAILYVGLAMWGVSFLFVEWFFDLMYGSEYREAGHVFIYLILAATFWSYGSALGGYIIGRHKYPGLLIFGQVIALVLSVCVSYSLIPLWGIVGAGASTVTAYAVVALTNLLYVKYKYRINFKKLFWLSGVDMKYILSKCL